MTDLDAITAMLDRAKIKYELSDSRTVKKEALKKPGWTLVDEDYRTVKSLEIRDGDRIAVFMEFELDGSLRHMEGGYD